MVKISSIRKKRIRVLRNLEAMERYKIITEEVIPLLTNFISNIASNSNNNLTKKKIKNKSENYVYEFYDVKV